MGAGCQAACGTRQPAPGGPRLILTLTQALHTRGNSGEPIPTVFKALDAIGVTFRQGQLHLIAAGPGTGKSAFALNLALKSGVPTMYFSADSDAFTQYVRAAAHVTGWTTNDVEAAIHNKQTTTIDSALETYGNIRWNFDASPSIDEIEESLRAYAMVYGYPAITIIDNVTNVDAPEMGEGHAGLDELCAFFHDLARQTGTAVILLHHVTGIYNDGMSPIPLSGIKGQVGRVPEVILTMHRGGTEYEGYSLRVSNVKNRGGRADASGFTFAELGWIPERMRING
ncbi:MULTISPECIES: DnaB-like helicase C-terminal domain-containing protein [unclassified Streptomyces]|uniref:DnaB-like helicase C-terminal domain-containing protein n=1 Tax=unclassified Streptomyces TaxID=2593676 RepID=UPI0022AE6F3F|nr:MULTISPECIES: DnaB-like helicase C-terminal domain-containing protein [unclassified Streptomyces]MCZ4097327.1 AAA family ATPase [Streptomyces sp. H39-C1]MCZ4120631.1 AAA family ATPase [Streptomyces sp. H39-S7]